MSVRVRIIQFLVAGLLGLTVILYTADLPESMDIRNLQFQLRSHAGNNIGNTTVGKRVSTNVSDSEIKPVKVEPVFASRSNISTHVSERKIAEKNVMLKKGKKEKTTPNGKPTKYLYESGFIITNEKLCPNLGSEMKLLILVTSSPIHSDARMAIRQTWGHFNQRRDIAVGFVLGNVEDEKVNSSIKAENELYSDMIQAKFIDSYNNLTLKTVSILQWIDTHCGKVPFILKTDDDMFINIPRLLSLIEKYSKYKNAIFGRLAKKWKPIRSETSKYHVSAAQFSPTIFPDFTTGPAYLFTKDVVHKALVTALDTNYLKLEDVFLTGVVGQKLNFNRIHVPEFFNKRINFSVCNVRKCISIHMVKFHEQYVLWEKLHDLKTHCN